MQQTTIESKDRVAEEARLMAETATGSRASFEELHSRYAGLVFTTIYKVLNDRQDAEDVSQEVFSQIWQKAHLYDVSKGKPLTWVVTMARNRAIDRLRSKQRRSRLRDEMTEDAKTFEATAERQNSVDAVYARERASAVRSAVTELSKEQREAIELAYFSGLTQNEIADRLGQPLGTVKARIRRGVMKLRGAMDRRL